MPTTLTRRALVRSAIAGITLATPLGACGDDEASGPTYSTTAFVVPFDVAVPNLLPSAPTVDSANFVTWQGPADGDPAVRFMVPVKVYRPGDSAASNPPGEYLDYLLTLTDAGASFTDTEERTVDGRPATLVTANTSESLDGSLGCQAVGIEDADCYGIQPDVTLRVAVIDLGDDTLLAWWRHDKARPRRI